MLGYPVHMIERDSWSGPEDGGYLVFNSEAARTAYVHSQTKDRKGPAPEFYVQYDNLPPFELLAESVKRFNDQGYFYTPQLTKKVQVV